jgi:hypothetical protein
VITAGSSNVQVTSPLLVSGLFNNAGNDPPPNSGDVLKWTGAHIEWEAATATSGFPVQSSDSNISLSVSGSNLNITNSNVGGNISLSTEGNTYIQIGSQSSAIRLGDLNPSSPDLPSIVLNDAATTINGTNMANNVSIWNPVGATYIGAASNVQLTSPLLVGGLLNNASNSPAPTNGQLLSWNGTNIEWMTANNASGVYIEPTGGSPNVTISITGMTSTGLVSLTYVHAGGGGGSQYLKSCTVGSNQVALVYNTNVDVNDQIIWGVLKYSA